MANYFSNHSHSRFLPSTSSSAPPQPAPSRPPPSKHFSTSVSTTASAQRSKDSSPNTPSTSSTIAVHPLKTTWVFWFRQQRPPGNKIINYEDGIKKISAFSSVESFWSLWTHLSPPSALQPTTDYLLFHTGIRRPVWEDPLNLPGGKWIIRLRKGVADRLWEDLVMAIIGDQFDECRAPEDPEVSANWDDKSDGSGAEWPEICGCTISVRQSEDILTLWNRFAADVKTRDKIRDALRKVLNLPTSTIMEYKTNNDSMHDKSSFRNSAIDRSTLH